MANSGAHPNSVSSSFPFERLPYYSEASSSPVSLFSLHILPPGLVRIRHYGIVGNNRRKRDIEAARAIFISRGRAVELQPRSGADPPFGGMCCPSCGKAGIRLVAFTDAAAVLHMTRVGPIPCDSS